MILLLLGGVTWLQILQFDLYSKSERLQNQRRVIIPAPRGKILDRNGKILASNRPRFSLVLDLTELRPQLRTEYNKIYRNFSYAKKGNRPSIAEMHRLSCVAVAQKHLDKVNAILGCHKKVNAGEIERHSSQALLLPYILLDNLRFEEYARLIERLPVGSPLQVYTSSTRYYPYGRAASHVLGFSGIDDNPKAEDLGGKDLLTFKMKGLFGRDGLAKKFDEQLQGEAGGAIYRVDPAGYKINPPLEKREPVQGNNIVTSLDIDLQQAAEAAMADKIGAAVAMDVNTGEVFVMASTPNYDLNDFVPHLSFAKAKEINDKGAWFNRAIAGTYAPGSIFKIITTIAGLRSGKISPTTSHVFCSGSLAFKNHRVGCPHAHGSVGLAKALAVSCNMFFYNYGLGIGPHLIANEARRFGYDQPTSIELPGETNHMIVPDPHWKKKRFGDVWHSGDTNNYSVGQGFLNVTPLQVACMTASLARGETRTTPLILHDNNRQRQHSEPIGITPAQYNVIVQGMENAVQFGTARLLGMHTMRVAAKTGTAQVRKTSGTIELAWLTAFAPIENPQIAVAVVMEGQNLNTNHSGGIFSSPIAKAILEKWQKKYRVPPPGSAPSCISPRRDANRPRSPDETHSPLWPAFPGNDSAIGVVPHISFLPRAYRLMLFQVGAASVELYVGSRAKPFFRPRRLHQQRNVIQLVQPKDAKAATNSENFHHPAIVPWTTLSDYNPVRSRFSRLAQRSASLCPEQGFPHGKVEAFIP